jgi:hypothetical protein
MIEINPNYLKSYIKKAEILNNLGWMDEGLQELIKAFKLLKSGNAYYENLSQVK